MTDKLYIAAVIAATALMTWLTRALPYLLFGGKRGVPPMVSYLGSALPPAIMVILVLYCLRGIQFLSFPYGLPELLSAGLVVWIQYWKKNAILSVALGTACYMCLIRTVFRA